VLKHFRAFVKVKRIKQLKQTAASRKLREIRGLGGVRTGMRQKVAALAVAL
jgi:hypothetical protein